MTSITIYYNIKCMQPWCRPFVVGLSDEAGAGANVGLAAKARHAPTALEVARVDDYIQQYPLGH